MNIFKNALKLTIGITLFFLLSCKKDQNDSNNNTLTNEISKVETIYQEGAIKLENKLSPDSSKIETSADESYKEKIRQDLEKSFSKQITYLKSGSNNVGILKNGSCGTYQELLISMDCEDNNCQTSGSGYIGSNNIDIGGNVTLAFCVVPANFSRCEYDYAVLDITGNPIPSGVNGITRIVDNEDNNNKNKVTLGGNTITGAMGACDFNSSNTKLAFLFYPAIAGSIGFGSDYFSLYLHYFGVFGSPVFPINPQTQIQSSGQIISDDEDNRNGNGFSQVKNIDVDCTTNIIGPGINTTLKFIWINLP